jgi:hypothetical protein
MEQLKSTTIKEGVMKKLFLGITVLALVLFASSAMAAEPKVPKSLCLTYASGWYSQLIFKSLGNLPTSGGNMKMYEVLGNAYTNSSGPVHGGAYINPNSSTLHATYNRKTSAGGHTIVFWELLFDLVANTGTVYIRYDYSDGSLTTQEYPVTPTDCSTMEVQSTASMLMNADKAEGQ